VALAVSAPVDCEPVTGLAPDHAPEAVHEVALLDVHVRVEVLPRAIVLGLALKLTVAGVPRLTVTVADCAALPPAPLQVRAYVAVLVSAPVDCVPLTALLPVQAPEARQEVALAADHVSVEALPLATLLGPALSMRVGAAGLTETVADCTALPLAPLQDRV
jgi:hypothetical protein